MNPTLRNNRRRIVDWLDSESLVGVAKERFSNPMNHSRYTGGWPRRWSLERGCRPWLVTCQRRDGFRYVIGSNDF